MQRKIICIMISTLFFASIIPTINASQYKENQVFFDSSQFGSYFIFGFMKHIDPEESLSEYEVVSFVILRGNGETIRLNDGEMIKLHGSIIAISFNNFFMGVIGDYSIIG